MDTVFHTLNVVVNILECPPELCLESAYHRTHFSLNISLQRPERESLVVKSKYCPFRGLEFHSLPICLKLLFQRVGQLVLASTGALARMHKHTLTHFYT